MVWLRGCALAAARRGGHDRAAPLPGPGSGALGRVAAGGLRAATAGNENETEDRVSTEKVDRCRRCGGEWHVVGPDGWLCVQGHWTPRPRGPGDGASRVAVAAPKAAAEGAAPDGAKGEPKGEAGPVLVNLAAVRRRGVRWLWPGRLPLGKISILDGDPDKGKSLIALDLAARVSRGLPMPDGARGDGDGPAGVVLLSAEDDLEDTIGPRLDAAGADSSRVVALQAVRDENAVEYGVTLLDLPALEAAVRCVAARLVIIDPLMAYMPGAVDSHQDADVRRVLRPLGELAGRLGVAVLLVRHLNKGGGSNAIYRGGGSIGIIGAARSGLLAGLDPDDETGRRRVLAVTKSNLARSPGSLAYAIEERDGVPVIAWGGAVDMSSQSLLAGADNDTRPALNEAVAFLEGELVEGPQPARAVMQAARAAGITEITLTRARYRIGVRASRIAGGAGWEWSLAVPSAASAGPEGGTPNAAACTPTAYKTGQGYQGYHGGPPDNHDNLDNLERPERTTGGANGAVDEAAQPAPPCPFAAHRGSDWERNDGSGPVCGVCHPPSGGLGT